MIEYLTNDGAKVLSIEGNVATLRLDMLGSWNGMLYRAGDLEPMHIEDITQHVVEGDTAPTWNEQLTAFVETNKRVPTHDEAADLVCNELDHKEGGPITEWLKEHNVYSSSNLDSLIKAIVMMD